MIADMRKPGTWTGSEARRRGSRLVHLYAYGPPHETSVCGKLLGMHAVIGHVRPGETACRECARIVVARGGIA